MINFYTLLHLSVLEQNIGNVMFSIVKRIIKVFVQRKIWSRDYSVRIHEHT